jgi:hypothetical protein
MTSPKAGSSTAGKRLFSEAKRADFSDQSPARATDIRMRAEIRAGELLREMKERGSGRSRAMPAQTRDGRKKQPSAPIAAEGGSVPGRKLPLQQPSAGVIPEQVGISDVAL